MEIKSLTDIGIKRKDNQDNYWCARLDVEGEEAGIVCLCDGMGGLENGNLASRIVVESVRDYFKSCIDFRGVSDVIRTANKEVKSLSIAENSKSGTTCTVLQCFQGRFQIFHVGDSRCYKISMSSGNVEQLTKDHTVIEKYKQAGKRLPEHLIRKYRSTLTRCIGVSDDLTLDYVSGEYISGDEFLICSDGFWHNLQDKSFLNEDLEDLRGMINRCMNLGETDNITAVTLKI